MSAAVCLAAMIPARRAAWSGSPFFTAPRRIWRSASRDMVIRPRAIASRSVAGLSPTSTIFTRPRESTCVRRRDLATAFVLASREIERQALQRDGEVHAFQLHVRRHLQRAGREVENRLDARGDDLID